MFWWKRFRKLILCALWVAAILLSGCGKQGGELLGLPNPDPDFAFLTDKYPAAVAVYGPQGRGLCTGSVLSDRAILTATHCLNTAGTYYIKGPGGMITGSSSVKNGTGGADGESDFAILFPDEPATSVSNGHSLKIGRTVAERDLVSIVGWGCGAGMDSFETKRGSNKLRAATNWIIKISGYLETYTPISSENRSAVSRSVWGPKNYGAACNGDSGGPILRASGSEELIVGTTHAGGYKDDEYFVSQFTNLTRSDHQAWLNRVNSEHNLGIQFQ